MILGIQRFFNHNRQNRYRHRNYLFAQYKKPLYLCITNERKTSRKNKNKNLIKLEYYGNKIL